MLSIDCQTNKVLVEIDSEDNSLSSRIELLRLLLVVLSENVEEGGLLFRNLVCRERRFSWFNISIHFLSFIGMMIGKSTGSLLCGFAFAFDRAAKSFIFSRDACSSGRSVELSVSLLFESIANLCDP